MNYMHLFRFITFRKRHLYEGLLLIIIALGPLFPAKAQKQSSHKWIVAQQNLKASDKGPGTKDKPFKTISRAALLAMPGDTVLVHAGTYRERVTPAKGGLPGQSIVYMAYPGEKVYVKGSEIWKPIWQKIQGHEGVYSGKLDGKMFGAFNPFLVTAKRLFGKKSLGQVFVNGEQLTETDNKEDLYITSGSWMISPKGDTLYTHFMPTAEKVEKHLVEITVRDRIFAPHERGLGYITVRGFDFEHCANQFPSGFYNPRGGNGAPQAGAIGTRSGNHWIIEFNTIRYAKGLGLDCGSEGAYDIEGDQPMPENVGFHIICNNIISDNGAGGIAGYKQTGSKILNNLIERNNSLGWTAPETGGIKVHFFYDGLIEGNIIRDNDCSGIWLDNVWYNSRVTRNVIINSTGHGIFVELGEGNCLVDNNVIAFTKTGDGIYTHDASGVTIAHNLFYANSHFGIYMRIVTDRMTKGEKGDRVMAGTKNEQILNNVFIDNYRGPISIPLASERVKNNISDYNLFINGTQWQWEGLSPHSFVLNLGNGINDKEQNKKALAKALTDAFAKMNLPKEEQPNIALWLQQPFLTFDWWKAITGNDQHSFATAIEKGKVENGAIEKGSMSFAPGEMYIQFQTDKPFRQVKCNPVPGVDKDFYGRTMPSKDLLPGPFQVFKEGYNQMILRPGFN